MMGIEKDSGFWIPPGSEKDRPDVGIPAYVPLPDNTPPPEFDPNAERPDMDDHPREDKDSDKPDHHHEPEEDQTPKIGSTIVNDDNEKDDRDWDPFKDDDTM